MSVAPVAVDSVPVFVPAHFQNELKAIVLAVEACVMTIEPPCPGTTLLGAAIVVCSVTACEKLLARLRSTATDDAVLVSATTAPRCAFVHDCVDVVFGMAAS